MEVVGYELLARAATTGPSDQQLFGDGSSREQFRARMIASIPRWYWAWGHFMATTGVGISVLVLAVSNIRELRPRELVIVPVVLIISNCFEWFAHKHLLHRRWLPMKVLYDRHTPEHHRVYRYDDMAIRSWRELRLVLIPAAGVLGIVVTMLPAAAVTGWLFTPNTGWLFLLTSSSYVVSYELTHLAYHLPHDHVIGRLRFMRVMREHHARHHDPRLMQCWNFNVTVPLADWLFGTFASKRLIAKDQG